LAARGEEGAHHARRRGQFEKPGDKIYCERAPLRHPPISS
jgi:hypothetical protein